MPSNPTMILVFLLFLLKLTASTEDGFVLNGFRAADLIINGTTRLTPNGLIELTTSIVNLNGYAFHPTPFQFKSSAGKTLSFSTTFVFAIVPKISYLSGHGFTFLISHTTDLSSAFPSQYLGLFNANDNGKPTNRILAVEFDTIQNPEFQDIDANHIGIDINSLKSYTSHTAGYYDNTGLFKNLTLISGQSMQVWVDFDGDKMQLSVTLSPIQMSKPNRPLLFTTVNLSSLMMNSMYVGFSSSTGQFDTYHCIQGWSFKMNGAAEALNYAILPSLPTFTTKSSSNVLVVWLPVVSCSVVLLIVVATVLIVRRRIKFAELVEDWELEYGPHRFRYKDLFEATNGFKDKELLGRGGFGRVYRGNLNTSEVAVKKVSNDSRQGMREFVAEIVSMGRLRHRNLVQLLGYCRRKGELLLVYDYMPNGSLDKLLYDHTKPTLNWAQRFRIIKGVASGLLYLHEDWEQVVVHRDIKASNVLLDSELNGRLGDFGLARLYDRGSDPQTTHVVGTMGYLAPELVEYGKATTLTDVFAFGIFLLEVVCGRRPIDHHAEGEELVLMDWVVDSWRQELLIDTVDPRLREDYSNYEVELVLKLGLLCSQQTPAARPSMRQVMQILEGDAQLPELLPSSLSFNPPGGFDDYIAAFTSSSAAFSNSLWSDCCCCRRHLLLLLLRRRAVFVVITNRHRH